MYQERDSKDELNRLRTLVSTLEYCGLRENRPLPELTRKRALMAALLGGEIAPQKFKERVKEAGLSTRILTKREQLQKALEYLGRDAKTPINGKEYTFQEIFERFDEFEAQISNWKSLSMPNFKNYRFPNDPDAIINKLSDASLTNEERKRIYEAHNERWGIPGDEI